MYAVETEYKHNNPLQDGQRFEEAFNSQGKPMSLFVMETLYGISFAGSLCTVQIWRAH